MKPFAPIFIVMTLLMITVGSVLVIDTASADDSRTVTIQSGQAKYFKIDSFIQTTITYDVRVISGPNIDVILTTEKGIEAYSNPFVTMKYYPEASRLNTRSASLSSNLQGGVYYLVFDNSLQGLADSNGQAVTIKYSYSTSPGPLALLFYGVIASIVISVGIWYAFRWSKKHNEAHPMPKQQATSWPAVPAAHYCTKCGSAMEPWYNACPRCGQLVRPPEGNPGNYPMPGPAQANPPPRPVMPQEPTDELWGDLRREKKNLR